MGKLMSKRQPMVCEPFGEMWQQLGGEAYLFDTARSRHELIDRTLGWKSAGPGGAEPGHRACTTFDLGGISRWWRQTRERRPFMVAALAPDELSRLSRKGYKGGNATSVQRRKLAIDESNAASFGRWLIHSDTCIR